MGLYSRDDYEQDLEIIEEARVIATRRLLAGEIDGFKHVELNSRLDKVEQRCKNKLSGTRLILQDGDVTRKQKMNQSKPIEQTRGFKAQQERDFS